MGSISFPQGALLASIRCIRALALAVLALIVLGTPAAAQTVNRYTNTTDSASGAISNAAYPCSSPFTRSVTVGSSYYVGDVNVGVLMAHNTRSDITMYLVSPDGTRVQLTAAQGGTANHFNLTFDDEAGSSVSAYTAGSTATATTAVPPYSASYRPLSALTAFDGTNAAGTWTLEICDTASATNGTFYQFDLYLTETPAYADLSLAMSLSNSAPATGATVTYTLTVANGAASPQAANSVVVRDALPSGLSFVSASGTGTYNSGTGDWSVGTLNPGQNASLTITAIVTAGSGTSVTNSAEVSSSSIADFDSTPGNGATGEDDYATTTLTATATRSAGTPPTLTCSAGSALFDWDAQAWTAGTTSNNYTLTGIGAVNFAISNPASFLNMALLGGQSPARQNGVTGGYSPAQYSLAQLVDMANSSQVVTTTISLGTAAHGAQFRIFDVDYAAGQFADKVSVTGYLNGVAVYPTLTNGVSNYVIGNTAYGDSTSADTSANGNVVVTFLSPIDQIVIQYGNHSLAPANPGQQAIVLHDITLCKPVPSLSVTKISSVLSDPVNGTTNPKAIPGAVVEYCILVSNTGAATLTSVSATDNLPAAFTYTAGTMTSGGNCASATTAEDDNNTGADESDPYGASISGTVLTATASSIPASTAFALKFRGTVN